MRLSEEVSPRQAFEQTPATQRWLIERDMAARDLPSARHKLAEWAFILAQRQESGLPLADVDDFRHSLSLVLDSSPEQPTGLVPVRPITDLLDDKGLKARYLHRMIGDGMEGSADEKGWFDYWLPVGDSERQWLADQQKDLEAYPVARAIGRVLDFQLSDQ